MLKWMRALLPSSKSFNDMIIESTSGALSPSGALCGTIVTSGSSNARLGHESVKTCLDNLRQRFILLHKIKESSWSEWNAWSALDSLLMKEAEIKISRKRFQGLAPVMSWKVLKSRWRDQKLAYLNRALLNGLSAERFWMTWSFRLDLDRARTFFIIDLFISKSERDFKLPRFLLSEQQKK